MTAETEPRENGSHTLRPLDQIAHYRIEKPLGSGGMGDVYAAHDLALGRPVAIKLLRSDLDQSTRAWLFQEARASARLQHPGIATFHEAGEAGGLSYVAMELVEGETLRRRLQPEVLPVSEVLDLGYALLEALTHAHAARVLHRDIKPENIMLTAQRGAKLLDFGIAKVLAAADAEAVQTMATEAMLTQPGQVVGTIGYMSPEQIRGAVIDERSDLFSVGVVLYEALTGSSPFPGHGPMARMAAVLEGKVQPVPTGLRISPRLEQLLMRSLATDPADRFENASSFLAELRLLSEGETLVSLPDSLAILDFENLAGDPDDGWIGSGMAESLASDLSRVEGLSVLPRERVLRVQREESGGSTDIGRVLGCRWVLSGSFQKVGPSIRVTSQLTETSTGNLVRAEKVDGSLNDIFTIQDRLAEMTASGLERSVTAAIRPSPEESRVKAYELYARGRRMFHQLEKGTMVQAEQLYERAIQVNPGYAPALAGLSAFHAMRYVFTTDPAELHRSLEFSDRALEEDPGLAEAHVWRGYTQMRLGQPLEGFESELRALELDPSLFLAAYFANLCQWVMAGPAEALPWCQKSVGIEETVYGYYALGWAHLELGNLVEARWSFGRAVELEKQPGAPKVAAVAFLAESLRRSGDLGEARRLSMEGLDAIEQTDAMHRDYSRIICLSVLARTALAQEDTEAASIALNQIISQITNRPRALGVGHLYVQAKAGLILAGEGQDHYDEAVRLFSERDRFNWEYTPLCFDGETLFELYRAARLLGRREDAQEHLSRAREAHSGEARMEDW